ncbi:type III PLP-dependent enzyme [Virgisporangium aurantiacum]|uniref:ornithine decarboxylase n=1 Tax=Virgisporangium aurantiacum TaxID=175570 RepID=A0A8J4DYW4_9ACTN|nr:type III PLP-dependent enzyme [Virgisporangium aurantiacum]GIJ55359.1 ornithine decarboxylase [Virgisporangium aurantiacum]
MSAVLTVPAFWPRALAPDVLASVQTPTPYLITDLSTVADRYHRFCAALPGIRPHYAMKCNSSPEILRTLADAGAGFEVASLGELKMLQYIGVDPADVLYSNPIKPPSHVAAAHAAGLWRFSFDSPGELDKIAEHAPGSAVYLRLRVDDSNSMFPLSRKFGATEPEAADLLRRARKLGLRPYGLTFHVGSQSAVVSAWRGAVAAAGRIMAEADVTLTMLNIGGGFPSRYVADVPEIEEIGAAVMPAIDELLPYRPSLLTAEPGRHLVAESGVLVATVLGRETRDDENWIYLDVGAFNGMMETLQTGNTWEYPLWTSRSDHGLASFEKFTVTGPSCDSSDTMFYGVDLPSTIAPGDRVYIGSAGAYTLSYASGFNGFPPPTPVFVDHAGPA